MKIKTIDIQAKEWFDKINGNSYFSAVITLSFGLKNQKQFKLPFQYGYGESYKYKALELLKKEGLINTDRTFELYEQGIVLRSEIQTKCLKKEVVNFGIL